MKKSVYLIQPSYRAMDGKLIKGLPIFNYAINMPILSACIPDDWQKRTCIEYFDDVDMADQSGIIIMSSPGYDISHAIDIVRQFKEKGKFIIFGSHTDDLSDKLMRKYCDVVYYGYPNPEDMSSLLQEVLMGINQREYRWGYGVDYAFDYSVLPSNKLPFIPMMASTGCKNDCSYCCYPPVFGGKYRLRHVERVIDDLRAVEHLNQPVSFLDGNLYNNREYLLRLCKGITDAKLHIKWGGQSTIDIADDAEVLSALREANCKLLLFGLETLESANEEQLHKTMYPVVHFEDQIKRIQSASIKAGTYFIFGLDYDTAETFTKVKRFITNTNVAIPYLHVLVPIPGTEIYNQLQKEGRLLADNFEEYLELNPEFSVPCSYAYFNPVQMTATEVEKHFLRLNKEVYTLPKILRRSFDRDPFVMGAILKMNLEARKKYKAMERGYVLREAKRRRQNQGLSYLNPEFQS